MLDKITFAKRYARALFQLLNSHHELDHGYQELVGIREVLKDTPQLVKVLNNVSFPEANKKRLVKPLIDNVSSKYVKNLIHVVYECNRMDNMNELIDQFERLYDHAKKIVHAELITVISLDDQQKQQLKQAFAKRMNANQVIFTTKIDQSIIGGVIIKSSNVIFDGSVKTKINNVKQLLLN